MAKYITEPPSPDSPNAPSSTVGPVKTKHIIAIRGPAQQSRYLVGALKAYIEGPAPSPTEISTAPRKTVEVIEEPGVNKIEITALTADITLVSVKEDCEVVGASVVYNIEVPA